MEITLNDFNKKLKQTSVIDVSMHELVTLKKLISTLEDYTKSDFGKLTIKEIENKYPYFLLERSRASINGFLLYKKMITKLQ